MDNWEKRAEFTKVLGYVFNVSLVYFLVLAVMGGTLQSQISNQNSIVLADTVCPVPVVVDSTIVLSVAGTEKNIDCRDSDITIQSRGILKLLVEDPQLQKVGDIEFQVRSLTIHNGGQLLVENQGYPRIFTIKSANNVLIEGEIIIAETDFDFASATRKVGIQTKSLEGNGVISALNGEIQLICSQPNRFLGSYLVGTGSLSHAHCADTLVDLPSGLLDKLKQINSVSPSTSTSSIDVYSKRVAAIFHQIDTDTSGIVQNPIPSGGYIANREIVFVASISKLAINNFADETLQMQIELKQAEQPFDGRTGLYTSESVQVKKDEQKTVTLQVRDLIVGAGYKWRMRTLNPVNNVVSNWEEFGENDSNAPDFIVTSAAGLQLDLGSPNIDLSESSTITLSVKTSTGDLDSAYRGTVHFQSSAESLQLPEDYTFTAADNGKHIFKTGVKPFEIGRFIVTAEDKNNPILIDSTSLTVTVPNVSYLYIGTSTGVTTNVAPITLSWMSNNVSHLSVDTQRMETTASGAYVVTPEKNTTYFVNGIDLAGKRIAAAVDVKVKDEVSEVRQGDLQSCPVLDSFRVDKTLIKKGEFVVVSWSVANAQSITIDAFGSRLANNGSAAIELQQSQDITLWAKTGNCIKNLSNHVTVVDLYPWEGPIGILIGGILLETVALYLGAVQLNMWLPVMHFIHRLRRKRACGVVYDADTKLGVSGIVVRLWNKTTGRLEDTSMTNDQGVFSLTIRTGKYVIKLVDSAYEMTEKNRETASLINEYANPYYGEVVTFAYDDSPFMVSIPVRHVKKGRGINRQFSRPKIFLGELLSIFAPLLILIGFLYSVAVVLLYPSWFTYAILGAYLLVITLKAYVLLLENRHVGHVYGVDGHEMGGVRLEIVDPETNKRLAAMQTDNLGRYNFFVPNKKLLLQLSHEGYKLLNRNVTKDGLSFDKEPNEELLRIFTENILVYPSHEELKKVKVGVKKNQSKKSLPVSDGVERQL